ncbi:MAG: hypothetical protein K6G07_05925 [Lachnospiraceae bacterium]|nr:hypothetical protein [Lachnospiraceae bacterium]
MDGFMDKLAKRFNAGEMIKANGQAEARDLKRAREQSRKYEEMMQEIRRLHLKNAEITEQVQQLTQVGIERLEEYNSPAYGEGIRALSDEAKKNEEAIAHLEEMLGAFEKRFESVEGQLSDVGSKLSGVDEKLYGVDGRLSDVAGKVSAVDENVRNFDNAGGVDEEELRSAVSLITGHVTGQVRQIGDDLGEKLAANEQNITQKVSTDLSSMRLQLEDHVHKENVKVYRNVQAVITDESGKKFSELSERMDRLEGQVKKSGGKGLMVFTCIFALASLVLQVLQMLNLLPF